MNAEWIPLADIPRLGGWQRIAAKMGIHATPELIAKVDARRRWRRREAIERLQRLDDPPDPTPHYIHELIDKLDEVIDVLASRQVIAPPRPTPRPNPNPGGGRPGKGGVRLP